MSSDHCAVPRFVALLRAINVGGTGKLPMAVLKAMCERLGHSRVVTYIASGNVVFDSADDAATVGRGLAAALADHAGQPVSVLVRTGAELEAVVAGNPFAGQPGNRVVALFVDEPLPLDALDHATNVRDEVMLLGPGAIYIHYGDGMADSRLKIPVAARGTARNMNTVVKLAALAAA